MDDEIWDESTQDFGLIWGKPGNGKSIKWMTQPSVVFGKRGKGMTCSCKET